MRFWSSRKFLGIIYICHFITKENFYSSIFLLSNKTKFNDWSLSFKNNIQTLLLVRKTAGEIYFCKWNSISCSKMDLNCLSEWSDQVLNLVLFDSSIFLSISFLWVLRFTLISLNWFGMICLLVRRRSAYSVFAYFTEHHSTGRVRSGFQSGLETAPLAAVIAGYCNSYLGQF